MPFIMHLSVVALSFLLWGCDSFTLAEHFSVRSDSPAPTLIPEKTVILRGETIDLNVTGGTPPYAFQKEAKDLYSGTQSLFLGAFGVSSFTAGYAIGTITLSVADSAGRSSRADVTVIPPPAQNVLLEYDTVSKRIVLSWEHPDTTILSGFLVRYTSDNVTYIEVPVSQAGTEYIYSNPPQNRTYSFCLFAVSGAFRSAPVEKSITVSPS